MNVLAQWVADSPFATATWVDGLDIVLMAAVVYGVLMVLRGTRAMQSLVGLGLLLALYVFARASGLSAIVWVFDNLLVYLVLAVLILFQADIRRALETAGGRFLLNRKTVARSEAAILEELIKTSFLLARRKIGALIVLEGSASLTSFTEGAHQLDALVSHELLQSLFHPSSPLHDGAVVVHRARIQAAGVFLPITLSKDVSRAYGTRHRAAIGLTEATDAVCVVVSEERGTVSVVSRGEIVPVADPNDLRQNLTERMESAVDAPAVVPDA